MRLLLTAVLLAASFPSSAEVFRLRYASDGTPGIDFSREALKSAYAIEINAEDFCGVKANESYCRLVLQQFGFDYEFVPVKVQAVEAVPASKELAKASLPERLDTTTRIPEMFWPFNKRNFFASTTFDRANKIYFAFFTGKAGEEVLEPEDGRLLKSSIPVQLDAETRYVITLQINIFDPEKSTLLYSPARGFAGKQNKVRADKAMQLIHNAGISVPFSKGKLQFYYSTDADPKTKKLAATRSLSFVKEDGRNTKYYTIRDEEMPKDKWVTVDLGGQPALLFRTPDDTLLIHEPN